MITLTQPRSDAEISQEPNLELNFDQFLAQCPEDGRYELVDGKMLKVPATRLHYDVAGLSHGLNE